MAYLILFGVVVVIAAILGAWCRSRIGSLAAMALGVLMTIGAIVLFFVNKSDSVADTLLERVADLSPPLVTMAFVAGWWLGLVLYKAATGPRR